MAGKVTKETIKEAEEAGAVYYEIEKVVIIAKKGSTVILQSGKPKDPGPHPN